MASFERLLRCTVQYYKADVDLLVGGRRFSCVRAVLAAASPVFDAMFGAGMKESRQAEVKIGDIEGVPPEQMADTFQLLVHFMYNSHQFQIGRENCINLMFAANYFQVAPIRPVS